MRKITYSALILMFALLSGCASSNSGAVYSRDEARSTATVKTGVVESVRLVKIEGTQSGVGAVSGAVVGGVAGSSLGGGRGSIITTVLGAVAGGLGGAWAENKLTGDDALEITVAVDGGGLVAVVQKNDDQFHAGDRVRILTQGNTTRVTH